MGDENNKVTQPVDGWSVTLCKECFKDVKDLDWKERREYLQDRKNLKKITLIFKEKSMAQQIVVESRIHSFQDKVNGLLDEGWVVVPHTHQACWRNVAQGAGYSIESDEGYFAIVLEKT